MFTHPKEPKCSSTALFIDDAISTLSSDSHTLLKPSIFKIDSVIHCNRNDYHYNNDLNYMLEIFMQLSRLSAALFRLNSLNVSGSSLRLASIPSRLVSTKSLPLKSLCSVIILTTSHSAWALVDDVDTQTTPNVVLDTIVVTSSADASADGLPSAYEEE